MKIYDEASQLSPADKLLPFGAGMTLIELSHRAEANGQLAQRSACRAQAAAHFEQAVRLDPDFMLAHFYYGTVTDNANLSVREFREAVRLAPAEAQLQARLNLGIALDLAGNKTEAIAQFEDVLRRDPTNAVANLHLQSLRGGAAQPGQP